MGIQIPVFKVMFFDNTKFIVRMDKDDGRKLASKAIMKKQRELDTQYDKGERSIRTNAVISTTHTTMDEDDYLNIPKV